MRRFSSAVCVVVVVALGVLFPAVAQAEAVQDPEYDLELFGQTRIGPNPGGIGVGDEISYVVTLVNRGDTPVPAGGAAINASVNRSAQRNASRITATGLNGSGFGVNNGGNCVVGNTARVIRCVNTTEIVPGSGIDLEIFYVHAEPEEGQLVFLAQAAVTDGGFDPAPGNNSFGGSPYVFADSGATTTTASTTSTTEPTDTSSTTEASTTTESTVDDGSTTTETTAEPTTTIEEATTTEPLTETTAAPTTQAPTTTATTLPPTTAPAGSVTLQGRADDDASAVLAATGTADTEPPEATELAVEPLAPVAEDGGFPLWPLAAVALAALGVAGATLAYHRFSEQDPPLVDIRQFN